LASLLLTVSLGLGVDILVYVSGFLEGFFPCIDNNGIPFGIQFLAGIATPLTMFAYSASLIPLVITAVPFVLLLLGFFFLFPSCSLRVIVPAIIGLLVLVTAFVLIARGVISGDEGNLAEMAKNLSLPSVAAAILETINAFKPLAKSVNLMLSQQLDVPFEKINGGDKESVSYLLNAFASKMNATPTAKPSLLVMMDFFRGLLPSYSDSGNPIEGLQQAIQDLVFNAKSNADSAEDSIKGAYTRFQEVAAAKDEIKFLGLSESLAAYYVQALDSHKAQGNEFIVAEYQNLKNSPQDAETEGKIAIIADLAVANGVAI